MKKTVVRIVGGVTTFVTMAAHAAIDTEDIIADIAANQVQLLLLGVAVLTCVYALRAVSWGRKI